jgi:hypothetical protein
MKSLVELATIYGTSWERVRLGIPKPQLALIYYLYMMYPLFLDSVLAGEVTKRRPEDIWMKTTIA